jgi:hypothetical protein
MTYISLLYDAFCSVNLNRYKYSFVCNERTAIIAPKILSAATAQALVALATGRPGYLHLCRIISTILKNTDCTIH